jgi:hypothetical protein
MSASLKIRGTTDTPGTDVLLCFVPGTPGYNASWFALTDIYWDPQVGDDNASAAIGSPVKTFTEIVRRYGSSRPQMTYGHSVTIHQLSAQTAGVDPVFFEPLVSGGGKAILIGTLQSVGVIPINTATVTAQNRSGPTRWQVSNMPGGTAAKNLLQDTTQNTWSTIDSLSGSTATVSQPVADANLTTIGIPTLTEASMASNDAFQVWAQPLVNLKSWRPHGGDMSGAGNTTASLGWVQDVEVADASGGNLTAELPVVNDSAVTVYSRVRFDSRVHLAAPTGRSSATYLLGCDVSSGVLVTTGSPVIWSGIIRGGYVQVGGNPSIDGDCVVHGTVSVSAGTLQLGCVFLDGTITLQGCLVNARQGANIAGPGIVWGSATNTLQADVTWWIGQFGSTYTITYFLSGAINFGPSTTGASFNIAAVNNPYTGGITLTPGNIDAHNGLQDPVRNCRFVMP